MNIPLRILILCTGNSARSIIAEAILNRLGEGKIHAYSAGSKPRGRVHPLALEILKSRGYPASPYRSKSWDEFSGDDAIPMDVVLTVCDRAANETCPIWPGQPVTAHWGIADPDRPDLPLQQQQLLFNDTYQQLETKIRQLVRLKLDGLDQAGLREKLQQIADSGCD
jgi:arsenate reductase (thioredoxin)